MNTADSDQKHLTFICQKTDAGSLGFEGVCCIAAARRAVQAAPPGPACPEDVPVRMLQLYRLSATWLWQACAWQLFSNEHDLSTHRGH